jgi:DNA-binding CsgD family transcriptional regulator
MRAANPRVARAIRSMARSGGRAEDVFRAAMQEIRIGVPVDGWCGLTLDPATLLMTGGVHEHGLTPTAIRRLLEIEYGESDANLFADLARSRSPVGVLSGAAGPPQQSARYRDVLLPSGYSEELRMVLRAGGACWGAFILFRRATRRAFSEDEVEQLSELSEPVADALRFSLMTSSAPGASGVHDRALIVLGHDNVVESATAPVQRLLEDLAEAGPPDPYGLPQSVQAIANEARRLDRDAEETRLNSEARIRLRYGRWVTLRASALPGQPKGKVIVFIQPAEPLEIAALILRAYGLTRREGQLVKLVLSGFDTEQIAESLGISAYTVQDHLKAIFEKVHVRSRKDLVARLFFTHCLPRIQKGVTAAPDGWFVE